MTDQNNPFLSEIEGIGLPEKKKIRERDKANGDMINQWNHQRKEEGSNLRINNGSSLFERFLVLLLILGILGGIFYGLYLVDEGKFQSLITNTNSCPEISCPENVCDLTCPSITTDCPACPTIPSCPTVNVDCKNGSA